MSITKETKNNITTTTFRENGEPLYYTEDKGLIPIYRVYYFNYQKYSEEFYKNGKIYKCLYFDHEKRIITTYNFRDNTFYKNISSFF